MNYIPRPGIVCTSLCGRNILVPSRIAAEECKTILPIGLMGSIIWASISNGYSMEKLLEAMHIFSKAPDEELIAKTNDFCQKLLEKGFILPKPEEAGSNAP